MLRYSIALLMTAGFSLHCVLAADPPPAPKYAMKQETPTTGTNIPRETVSSSFPYNLRYDELSEEDKQRLRSRYETMGPDDEPPFPESGHAGMFKALLAVQRRMVVRGEFTANVIVGADGRATGLKVYKSPDAQTTSIVGHILMLEKYKPALCKGQPCVQEFPVDLMFTLDY